MYGFPRTPIKPYVIIRNRFSGIQALDPFCWISADAVLNGSGGSCAIGEAVATCADLTGNSRIFTQSDSAKRPLYERDNGFPEIVFDGSNDYIQYGGGSSWSNIGQTAEMVFVVKSATSTVNGLIDTAPAQMNTVRAQGGVVEIWNLSPSTSLSVTSSAWVILNICVRRTSQRTITIYENGTLLSSVDNPSTTDIYWTNPVIGIINGSESPLNGKLREFIAFDRWLSATERANLVYALRRKHGV